MMYHALKIEPLTAFFLTTLVALGYVCLIFSVLDLLNFPTAPPSASDGDWSYAGGEKMFVADSCRPEAGGLIGVSLTSQAY